MKISIITATWNSEESIAATQRSILDQSYPRDQIEWIVVDGASTDHTVERIKAGNPQPDKLISEPDKGIYDALNKGVKMSTGDVIGFLHADDFFASSAVLKEISCTFMNSGAEAVYGDLQYVRPIAGGKFRVVRHWVSGVYYRRNLAWGWMPPHPSLYLRREIFERTKLSNGDYFDTSFSCSADYDFMMRLLGRYEVEPVYLRMVLIKMRLGGVSNRSLKHIIKKSAEDWRVINRCNIGGLHTLIWKNLGKIGQFFVR